jgi:hypothetical protein
MQDAGAQVIGFVDGFAGVMERQSRPAVGTSFGVPGLDFRFDGRVPSAFMT